MKYFKHYIQLDRNNYFSYMHLFCNLQVIIKIRDLNDNIPTFDIDDYNMTIIEHLPNGFEIMTFRATDRDKVNRYLIKYITDKFVSF